MRLDYSETEFENTIIEMAQTFGWYVHHTRKVKVQREDGSTYHATPLKGNKGAPDLTMAKDGRVVFAELKSEKAPPLSPEQRRWWEELTGRTWGDWHGGGNWPPTLHHCRDHEFDNDGEAWCDYPPNWETTVAVWRPRDWDQIEAILKGET